jgi:hypothetical protein
LVPPEDTAALAEALTRLLASTDERARLRAAIPASLAPFAAEEITHRWETVFDELTADC